MKFIADILRTDTEYRDLLRSLSFQKKPHLISGLCDGIQAPFCAALAADLKKKTVLVFPDEAQARDFAAQMSGFCEKTLVYPCRDYFLHPIEAASHDFEHERLSVLLAILSQQADVIVTSCEAVCQRTVPRKILRDGTLSLRPGDTLPMRELLEEILSRGYHRCELVEGRGQFSQRGGILDIFPPAETDPVRIEFFGDEVDTISSFDRLTQRRSEQRDILRITPAGEFYLSAEATERIRDALDSALKKAKKPEQQQALHEDRERLENGSLTALDLYLDQIYPEENTLLDYTGDYFYILFDSGRLRQRHEGALWHIRENAESACESGRVLAKSGSLPLLSYERFLEAVGSLPSALIEGFIRSDLTLPLGGIYSFGTKGTIGFGDNLELLHDDLVHYREMGYRICLICESSLSAKNLAEALGERQIPCYLFTGEEVPEPGNAAILPAVVGEERKVTVKSGFEIPKLRLVVLTDGSVLANAGAKKRRVSQKSSAAREKILSYADLKVGDYVVHINHGIGIYGGIRSIRTDGVQKDYAVVNYAQGDVLYVPCGNLDSLSKYIGKTSDGAVKIHRMDSAEWKKAKSRAKAASSAMARELIELYAKRKKEKGHAFSPDTDWQNEFETAFEYEETDGQLTACREIKRDMESEAPMDRILCGDVGFGKTEVALRGIFKCIMDNKQAAILVPTTILAWQHYQTVLARFRGFPIRVAMLSRFTPKKEAEQIVRDLKSGGVDLVIGTHKLLQKNIVFSDLGFLVIDEEQRFGVSHKERLKALSVGVDVLTLTATPIPRTLHMALSGIRDMSILEEAPGDRAPVQTYVLEYDEAVIQEAIRREIRRGGQVFYLLNNIELLERCAARISAAFPGSSVAVAHGQMDKEELALIWRNMVEGRIDVLVSTTIIETGIDIPNANTLIVENADRYGLSQLHQIRGRVGRSSRKAYAYLTYRKNLVLSEISAKRLSAIREYTSFGSGFKIAMRDLEIRGAGNILGTSQHGHMEDVGYDLYIKLLEEAIREEKGERVEPRPEEASIDVTVDAYIPERYVRAEEIRIDLYKKIAAIASEEDRLELTDELIDRFGEPPAPVINLMRISLLRRAATACGVKKILQRENTVYLYLLLYRKQQADALCLFYKNKLFLCSGSEPYLSFCPGKKSPLDELEQILKDYQQIISAKV